MKTSKMINRIYQYVLIVVCMIFVSCTKDFLEKKSDQKLLVPTTVQDFQSLLDNNAVMNPSPGLPLISSDDLYMSDIGFDGLSVEEKNAYTWQQDVFVGGNSWDWRTLYQQVFYSNVVLDGLEKLDISAQGTIDFSQVKGSALFYRSLAFYQLAEEFASPYRIATAMTDPGLPLPLIADVNKRYGRGTLKQLYDQIIVDLKQTEDLLPVTQLYKTRPCKTTVQALLARIYLSMGEYDQALMYSNKAITASPTLLDYNNIIPIGTTRPFPSDYPVGPGNPEVLLYKPYLSYAFFLLSSRALMVNKELFASYKSNDLRKQLFFIDRGDGVVNFRGTYSGTTLTTLFGGMAIDETYLISAECYVRTGKLSEGLATLNSLLSKRYVKSTFTQVTAINVSEALSIILEERRKQLITRGTRWTDLRRLNKDTNFAITQKRSVKNVEYILLPSSNRYIFPIPDKEVNELNLEQNPK